jgi:phosphomethylpyrimidine synthase
MTLIEKARQGQIDEKMEEVAKKERVGVEEIRHGIAEGTIVIPYNDNHKKLQPKGIGQGLKTKVNANFGTAEGYSDIDNELNKLNVALANGADAVMDLSTGPKIKETREAIIENSTAPVGTVPVYETVVKLQETDRAIIDMTTEDIFQVITNQAEDGVDFITVHCGLTRVAIDSLQKEGRISDIVSRGGSFMAGWMIHNDQENSLYQNYDRLLDIAYQYDIILSLGDGMRPGCLVDATDRAQIHELMVLGELVDRAREAGAQVMVEGPGHVPFDQIETNVQLAKELCSGAPFYVLGPLVTDIAPGYDHIVAAIGGTQAATAGADFLCYVTPAEHLGLPTVEEVKDGVITSKMAAHAADIASGNKQALEKDKKMALARKSLDWDKVTGLSIDPDKTEKTRRSHNINNEETCSMCGQYCALKIADKALK